MGFLLAKTSSSQNAGPLLETLFQVFDKTAHCYFLPCAELQGVSITASQKDRGKMLCAARESKPGSQEWESCMISLHQQRDSNWRCRGLTPGPSACEADALPLIHIPSQPGPSASKSLGREVMCNLLWLMPAFARHQGKLRAL